jgi:hypothetical protein
MALVLSCHSLVASKSGRFLMHLNASTNNRFRYEGAWVEDRRSGKGKLTLQSGEVYEGDFVENKKNGDGYVDQLVVMDWH